MSSPKTIVKEICPPALWKSARNLKLFLSTRARSLGLKEGAQDLNPYWDAEMAALLETWGDGNVWNEIPMFLFDLEGRVLDIACGTGKSMEIVKQRNPKLDVYGCDISDLLIEKAKSRGIPADKLIVCDATDMNMYPDNSFDYAYSIGSLEHFTEDGIDKLIKETARLVRKSTFHMMPTSRSQRDEGWMKTYQSFYNNSPDWWVAKFRRHFKKVETFSSAWNDDFSVGTWFVTTKL